MLSPQEIARLLTRYLDPGEANRRAQAIHDDMAAIGFSVDEDRSVAPAQWQHLGAQPQAEYVIPKTDFDLNGDDPDKAIEGSLLTRGNLLRLAQAVELGRRWIPDIWPGAFKRELLGSQHLDAINEVYWLKFWQGLKAVRRGPKARPDDPDADWMLAVRWSDSDYTINLEVKRRTGNLNAWFKKGTPRISMKKVGHKFDLGDERTLNLAALSVFQRPDAEAIRRVREKVQDSRVLDGTVIWIEDNHGGSPLLKVFKAEKKWAEALVKRPDREDLMLAAFTVGTLCRPEEVPQFLSQMFSTESPET